MTELRLEVGATSENQTSDVGLIVGDVKLRRHFGYFAHVIVTFFHPQSSKTKSRLTSSACKMPVDGNIRKKETSKKENINDDVIFLYYMSIRISGA